VTRIVADALAEGRHIGREQLVTRATGPEFEPEGQVEAEPSTISAVAAPSDQTPATSE
jgi:hypothetical protein